MDNSTSAPEEAQIKEYTYQDLDLITSCLIDETYELQQEFKTKTSLFNDRNQLLCDNDNKASVLIILYINLENFEFYSKSLKLYSLDSNFKLLYKFI